MGKSKAITRAAKGRSCPQATAPLQDLPSKSSNGAGKGRVTPQAPHAPNMGEGQAACGAVDGLRSRRSSLLCTTLPHALVMDDGEPAVPRTCSNAPAPRAGPALHTPLLAPRQHAAPRRRRRAAAPPARRAEETRQRRGEGDLRRAGGRRRGASARCVGLGRVWLSASDDKKHEGGPVPPQAAVAALMAGTFSHR